MGPGAAVTARVPSARTSRIPVRRVSTPRAPRAATGPLLSRKPSTLPVRPWGARCRGRGGAGNLRPRSDLGGEYQDSFEEVTKVAPCVSHRVLALGPVPCLFLLVMLSLSPGADVTPAQSSLNPCCPLLAFPTAAVSSLSPASASSPSSLQPSVLRPLQVPLLSRAQICCPLS